MFEKLLKHLKYTPVALVLAFVAAGLPAAPAATILPGTSVGVAFAHVDCTPFPNPARTAADPLPLDCDPHDLRGDPQKLKKRIKQLWDALQGAALVDWLVDRLRAAIRALEKRLNALFRAKYNSCMESATGRESMARCQAWGRLIRPSLDERPA